MLTGFGRWRVGWKMDVGVGRLEKSVGHWKENTVFMRD